MVNMEEERGRLVVRLAQIQAMHATLDALLTQLADTKPPRYAAPFPSQAGNHDSLPRLALQGTAAYDAGSRVTNIFYNPINVQPIVD
jgi:hypothetical protein